MADGDRESIRNQLKAYSQRRNIADDQFNVFIELAMSKANRLLRIPPLEAFTTPTLDSSGYFELPSLFLECKELRTTVNDKTIILERKAIHEVDWNANYTGHNPQYFSRFGDGFRVSPWNVEGGTCTMYYYKVIPKMTDDSQTNWFSLYAPEVLVYGGMYELAMYTRDDEGMSRWNKAFNEEINILQGVEDRASWSGSTTAISIHGSTQ